MKVLIVGAGLSGCTIAERLATLGHNITIIEKRDHIGGNCYDYYNEHNILISKYGAHLFHTKHKIVEDYVKQFADWIPWNHKVLGRIGYKLFPIPVNIDTVNTLFSENIQKSEQMKAWLDGRVIKCDSPNNSEEVALSRVGEDLYRLIFRDYTYKQWEKYPKELEPSVLARIPVRFDNDPHYFSDPFQALPKYGYTKFIENMIKGNNITVKLGVDYNHTMRKDYDYVIYTGPIDQYYSSSGFPKLEYRSIIFETEHVDCDYYQENSVINYPSNDEHFTRIVEYKHFPNQHYAPNNKTTIVREYTTDNGEPYYPVPTERNREVYKMYQKMAEADEEKGIFFLGRLANYKYYNMDEAILAALELADKLLCSAM
jgi:UDP-galactopyranose mutase